MRKDYYRVLGIARGESPQGIRTAFRDLARQHHPDRAGPAGTPAFREIVEAYRVLSDARRRREHDAELRERERSRAGRTRRREAEPIGDLRGADVFARPDAIRPSADALLDRILRNFAPPGVGKGERAEPLLCDVALSRAEAARGGVLPIRLPIVAACPACHGTGRIAGFPCRECDAVGALRSQGTVRLPIPPGVRSGTILEAPLERWGIRNLRLRARIFVGG